MRKDIKISGKLLDLNTHRQVAKVGMSVTLASVCLSALFMKNRSVKKFHVASGIAFT
ncbi:MAG: helicase, partial [Campylobacter concisus]|nr:helicase [Campylobacter concisus]